jgi:hypothetical protein
MNLVNILSLLISGGLIVTSIILPKIALNKSNLSLKDASILCGLGAGLGIGIFIYFGISYGDLLGSIIVCLISSIVVGFTFWIANRSETRN